MNRAVHVSHRVILISYDQKHFLLVRNFVFYYSNVIIVYVSAFIGVKEKKQQKPLTKQMMCCDYINKYR